MSGVGGQYNFVAMAHELPGGRSVLQVRSTRGEGERLASNIVYSYGQCTIPRHLRDIVITEYGIADVRGKTDEECIASLLAIADSRFQDELMREAKRSGKLRSDYRLPDHHRQNLPEHYAKALAPLRARDLFPEYPFGTDLTAEERAIARALRGLQAQTETRKGQLKVFADALRHGDPTPEVEPFLRRMDLHAPKGPRERLYQRLLAAALKRQDG